MLKIWDIEAHILLSNISRNIEFFNAISEKVWTHCLESISNIRIVFEQLRK